MLWMSLSVGLITAFPASVSADELVLPNEVTEAEIAPVDVYHIEYVLFEQPEPDMSVLHYEKAGVQFDATLSKQHSNPYSVQPLSPSQVVYTSDDVARVLDGTSERLDEKGYRVLGEFSWLQEIANDSKAKPLIIAPRDHFSPFWEKSKNAKQSIADGLAGNSLHTFMGELTIKRSRYMHAEIALNYYLSAQVEYANLLDYLASPSLGRASFISLITPTVRTQSADVDQRDSRSDIGADETAAKRPEMSADVKAQRPELAGSVITKSFSFDSSRRIKNGEIHYFDHPYLGLIVTITKIKPDSSL